MRRENRKQRWRQTSSFCLSQSRSKRCQALLLSSTIFKVVGRLLSQELILEEQNPEGRLSRGVNYAEVEYEGFYSCVSLSDCIGGRIAKHFCSSGACQNLFSQVSDVSGVCFSGDPADEVRSLQVLLKLDDGRDLGEYLASKNICFLQMALKC